MKVQLLRLWLLWGSSHTPYDLSRCVTEHGLGGPKRNSRTPPTCEAARALRRGWPRPRPTDPPSSRAIQILSRSKGHI